MLEGKEFQILGAAIWNAREPNESAAEVKVSGWHKTYERVSYNVTVQYQLICRTRRRGQCVTLSGNIVRLTADVNSECCWYRNWKITEEEEKVDFEARRQNKRGRRLRNISNRWTQPSVPPGQVNRIGLPHAGWG